MPKKGDCLVKIVKLSERNFKSEYGHDCIRYFENEALNLPFGGVWGKVMSHACTELHSHCEAEVFMIIQGNGRISAGDGDNYEIETGDLIEFHPFEKHKIENTGENELIYLSIYWNDQAQALKVEAPEKSGPLLITATPPTPNGDLHLGHLSGPFSAADIIKRSGRMKGQQCFYLTGTDLNQSYVKLRGWKESIEAIDIAEDYNQKMQRTLAAADVFPDHWADPSTSAHHSNFVVECFKKLYSDGYIFLKETLQPFCRCNDSFLSEAFIRGSCPHCGSESDGNACEGCGRPNDCSDLQNPHCKYCGERPIMKKVERFYFRLSAFQRRLETFIQNTSMSPHLRRLSTRMLNEGLPDIAVSQVTDWGIPVPIAGFEAQRIYVWFEMAPGYLAASQELAERENLGGWEYFWKGNGDVVQCFGFDNGYYHSLLFPAIFMAFDPQIRLPGVFVVNEFYRLNGKKFSTSRNHAIWAGDFVGAHGADYTKLYLSSTRPEDSQSNFEVNEFTDFVDNMLRRKWAEWIHSVAEAHLIYAEGRSCDTGAWDSDHRTFMAAIYDCKRQAILNYSPQFFSTKRIVRLASEIVCLSSDFLTKQSTALTNTTEDAYSRTTLALSLAAIRAFAEIMGPITPKISQLILANLGTSSDPVFTEGLTFCDPGLDITELRDGIFARCDSYTCEPVSQ